MFRLSAVSRVLGASGILAAWTLYRKTQCKEDGHATPLQVKIRNQKPFIDLVVQAYMEKEHIPGLQYAIIANGKIVFTSNFGSAIIGEESIPVQKDTQFRIASMSKSITAMAILHLRDRNLLSLDDPVTKYIPAMKVPSLSTDSPPLTIRHLLTMVSGFPQDDPWADRLLDMNNFDFLSLLSQELTLSNPTGVSFEYSNLAYAMLGYIITTASNMSYQDYIHANIFEPLGMTRTTYDVGSCTSLALGYRWEDNTWKTEPLLEDGIFGAMGGVITTMEDFCSYVLLLLSAWPPRDDPEHPVLHRASLREMQLPHSFISLQTHDQHNIPYPTPRTNSYAYGLNWNTDTRDRVWVRHAGGLPGYGSDYRLYPHHDIAIVTFTNRTYAPAHEINDVVMEHLFNAVDIPRRTLPISPKLAMRAKQLSNQLQEWHNVDKTIFADNFFMDKDEMHWKNDIAVHLSKLGKIVLVTPIVPMNHLRGTFNIIGEQGLLKVFFTMSPETSPKIQAMRLETQALSASK